MAWLGPALKGASDAANTYAALSQGKGDPDAAAKIAREELFMRALQEELSRQQENRRLDVKVPIVQTLTNRILNPSSMPGGFTQANAMPRTFGVNDDKGMRIPGAASMTQGGPAMSKEQYDSLIPDLSRFTGMKEQADKLTAGMTPDAYKKDSMLPLLNQFDRTEGEYLNNAGGAQTAGEEDMVTRLARGERPQDIVGPTGRAPHREELGAVPEGRNNYLTDADQVALDKMKAEGRSSVEIALERRRRQQYYADRALGKRR